MHVFTSNSNQCLNLEQNVPQSNPELKLHQRLLWLWKWGQGHWCFTGCNFTENSLQWCSILNLKQNSSLNIQIISLYRLPKWKMNLRLQLKCNVKVIWFVLQCNVHLTVRGVTENPHSIILHVFPHSIKLVVRGFPHFTVWVISGQYHHLMFSDGIPSLH